MAEPAFRVEGLNDVIRDLRMLDSSVSAAITRESRAIARDVVAEAQKTATEKGLAPPGWSGRGTGALLRGIKVSVRGGIPYVVEGASRNGYYYPRVYEYGRGGDRSFLRPAVERSRAAAYARMDRALRRITSDF
jgi:hypothetical protein